ncbi:MAG TPA: aldo/keto reductase [Methylophilaceae bacterium]
MKFHTLGNSALKVSELCLGTMTFGEQNTAEDAANQLDYAVAHGINFIDTAEMYPVPPRAETALRTEHYIGQWLKQQQRDKLIIATKIAGPARGFSWLRDDPKVNKAHIGLAIEGSLQRLNTDYVDLYQIHWPDRNVPFFGQTAFQPENERDTTPILEQLHALGELVKAGKVRYLGLSNESPWGLAQFLKLADEAGLPRVISIQNAYNLINRIFEYGLAEMCYREQVGLMAYSPLGFGVLTGKYTDGKGSGRLSLFPGFGQRYAKPYVAEAVAAYANIALSLNITPATLALAYVRSRWFVASTIIGATTMQQLTENIASINVELSTETLQKIEDVHKRIPNPAP